MVRGADKRGDSAEAEGGLYYVLAASDVAKAKTRSVPGPTSAWNDTLQLDVDHPFGKLEVFLWRELSGGSDQFLGRVTVPLVEICDGKPHQNVHPLQGRAAEEHVAGELELLVQFKYIRSWDILYRGIQYMFEQQWTNAAQALTSAIQSFPDVEHLYSYRSEVFLQMNKLSEAMADAGKVVDMNPNWAEGYYRVGRAFFAAQDYTRAEEAYQEGLKKNPTDPNLVQGVELIRRNFTKSQVRESMMAGKACFSRREFVAATLQFTRALEANPASAALLMYRAIAYMANGNNAQAYEDAMQIARLHPDWPKTEAAKQGMLGKRGRGNIKSKPRWFVLKHRFLYYYDSSADTEPNGVICLAGFEIKPEGRFEINAEGRFQIAFPERSFRLKATSDAEKDEWVRHLTPLADSPLSLPLDQSENVIYWNTPALAKTHSYTALLDALPSLLPIKLASTVARRIDTALTTVSISNADHEGWLAKRRELIDEYKQRWFVLKDASLHYFDDQQPKDPQNVTAQGLIELQGTTLKVTSALLFMFEIARSDHVVYKLRAENAHDFGVWIDKLGRVCKRLGHHLDSSSILQPSDDAPAAPPSPVAPLSPATSRPAPVAAAAAAADWNSSGSGSTTTRRDSGREWSDSPGSGRSATTSPSIGRIAAAAEGPSYERKVTVLTAGGAQAPTSPSFSSEEVGWGEAPVSPVLGRGGGTHRIARNQTSHAELKYFKQFGLDTPPVEARGKNVGDASHLEKGSLPPSLSTLHRQNSLKNLRQEAVLLESREAESGGCCSSCVLM